MTYSHFEAKRIAGALGAEITGLDLSRDLDEAVIDEIRRALLDHLVLFFRDQTLTMDQQLAFARRFGPLDTYPMVKGIEGFPELVEVRKEADEKINFGGLWHSDTSYLPEPPRAAILYAKELPPYGGDTLYANMYMAYDALSDGLKAALDGLFVVNSGAAAGGAQSRSLRRGEAPKEDDRVAREAVHPIIRTIPETGRKVLYCNGAHTLRIEGWTEAESAPLLAHLYAVQQRPEFSCRFRWTPGAVAFWDNRTVQHNAINDYHGFRRIMHRCAIKGPKPV